MGPVGLTEEGAMQPGQLKQLLRQSFAKEGVVLFVGSGVSVAATFDPVTKKVPAAVSWSGLLRDGLERAGKGDGAWADAMRRQLSGAKVRWDESILASLNPAILVCCFAGVVCAQRLVDKPSSDPSLLYLRRQTTSLQLLKPFECGSRRRMR